MPTQTIARATTLATKVEQRQPILSAEGVVKEFQVGDEAYSALRGIDAEIYSNDFTIIIGPSGSGKSTFLNVLIGLETPSAGKVWFNKERIDTMEEDERAALRAGHFGIVHQQPVWVKSLSVLENVALPLLIEGISPEIAYQRAEHALKEVDMIRYAKHKPTEISGGQQQRISLARALINDPKILVLDEPTGNLDTHAADMVMGLLQNLQVNRKRTILMVTHNLIYLPYANRVLEVRDGMVSESKTSPAQTTATVAPSQPAKSKKARA